jgi:hypothetical protein
LYNSQVQELQKECINKRRRANLPSAAKEIFGQWLILAVCSLSNQFVEILFLFPGLQITLTALTQVTWKNSILLKSQALLRLKCPIGSSMCARDTGKADEKLQGVFRMKIHNVLSSTAYLSQARA